MWIDEFWEEQPRTSCSIELLKRDDIVEVRASLMRRRPGAEARWMINRIEVLIPARDADSEIPRHLVDYFDV